MKYYVLTDFFDYNGLSASEYDTLEQAQHDIETSKSEAQYLAWVIIKGEVVAPKDKSSQEEIFHTKLKEEAERNE